MGILVFAHVAPLDSGPLDLPRSPIFHQLSAKSAVRFLIRAHPR